MMMTYLTDLGVELRLSVSHST